MPVEKMPAENTTNSIPVKIVPAAEREKAVAAMVLAFSTDPMVRWSIPNPDRYLSCFPDMARAFSGNAFEMGTAYSVADFSGTAIWLAPGSEPDFEALASILEKAMPESRFAESKSLIAQMEAFHPTEPCWYLPLIGVDPMQQGKGYGSALMRDVLHTCDHTDTPAYLESSNPANIPFYERHGFEVLGKIQTGLSPILYPMLRKPR